jgi:hypothetical protein
VYVVIETTVGDVLSFDVPAKDDAKARVFAQKVNGASALFASA